MGKPKYSFNSLDAAKTAATKAATLSEKVQAVCSIIDSKNTEVAGMNNTFSANTQVCNRFDQLSTVVGEFVEPLNTIAAEMRKMVNASEAAMEASKNAMM